MLIRCYAPRTSTLHPKQITHTQKATHDFQKTSHSLSTPTHKYVTSTAHAHVDSGINTHTDQDLTKPCPLDDLGKSNGVDIHRSPRPVQYESEKDSRKRTPPRARGAGGKKSGCFACCGCGNSAPEEPPEAAKPDSPKNKPIGKEDQTVPASDPNSIMYPKPNPPNMQPQLAFIPVMTTSPINNGYGSNPGYNAMAYSISGHQVYNEHSPGPYMYDNMEDPAQYMYDPQAAYNRAQQQQQQQQLQSQNHNVPNYGAPAPQGANNNNNSNPQTGSQPPASIPHHGAYGNYGFNHPEVNPQHAGGQVPRLNVNSASAYNGSMGGYTQQSPSQTYLTIVAPSLSYMPSPGSITTTEYGTIGHA